LENRSNNHSESDEGVLCVACTAARATENCTGVMCFECCCVLLTAGEGEGARCDTHDPTGYFAQATEEEGTPCTVCKETLCVNKICPACRVQLKNVLSPTPPPRPCCVCRDVIPDHTCAACKRPVCDAPRCLHAETVPHGTFVRYCKHCTWPSDRPPRAS
jgi:hypothetical protein